MFPANGAANRTIQPREESLNSNVFSSPVLEYYYHFLSIFQHVWFIFYLIEFICVHFSLLSHKALLNIFFYPF